MSLPTERTRVAASPLPALLTVTFIGTLGFSVILPFFVFLVRRLGGGALAYGTLVATYSAFQLVGAPLLGRWSDGLGRRRVLLVSQIGTLVAWLLFLVAVLVPSRPAFTLPGPASGLALTLPLALLFLARALDGLTGGNVSVANAYLADVTAESERAASFGRMAVASNLGLVIGPAVGGLLVAGAAGEIPAIGAAIALSIVGCWLIARRLPDVPLCGLERRPEGEGVRKLLGQEQVDCWVAGRSLRGEGSAWNPAVRRLLLLTFLVYLAFNFFYVAFPLRAAESLGWSPGELGAFFALLSLLLAAVQGWVLPRLTRVVSEESLVWLGSAVLAAGFALFRSDHMAGIAAAMLLMAAGNGAMWPSLQGVLSRATGPGHQGAVQGAAGSVAAAASIVGLLAGGALYRVVGARLFLWAAGVTVLIAVLALLWRPGPVAANEVVS